MNDKEQVHDDYPQGGSIGGGNPEARKNTKRWAIIFTVAVIAAFILAVVL